MHATIGLTDSHRYTTSQTTHYSRSISIEVYSSHNDFKSTYKHHFTVENREVFEPYFTVVVRDTGIGISKDSISKVFERFYKVPTLNFESHLGSGIGLALVKSLTLLHKGFIIIYSERGKGTDIEVCFPVDKSVYKGDEINVREIPEEDYPEEDYPEEDYLEESHPEESFLEENQLEEAAGEAYTLPDVETEGLFGTNRNKILLAEDNEDLRKLIKDYLSESYEVIEAEDGLVATELLKEKDVDLIDPFSS